MKTGLTLHELALEVRRQQNAKADYLMPTRAMEFRPTPDGVRLFGISEIGPAAITARAHTHFSNLTKVPKRYYDTMMADAPDLLCQNLNHWLHETRDRKRLVRTLDGKVRAVLSDSYRTLDNVDFVSAVIPALSKIDATIRSCAITEDNLYLKVISNAPPIQLLKPGQQLGVGHEAFDEVQSGLTLSNSEVGAGRLAVQPGVHTIRCTNLATFRENVMAKTHLGSRIGGDGGGVERYLSDDTRRTRDAAIWKELADVARASLDGRFLADKVRELQQAKGVEIDGDIPLTVERIGQTLGLQENEQVSVLDELIRAGDLTAYGLHSAITQVSQRDDITYDRATDLEMLGATVISLPPSAFHVKAS